MFPVDLIVPLLIIAVIAWVCMRAYSKAPPPIAAPGDLVETLTATDQDVADATRYAVRRLCEDQGFTFSVTPDQKAWRCDFNAQSCARNSRYPPVEADEGGQTIARPYYEWNTDLDACILGIAPYRKACEELGMNYDVNRGKCFVTKQYCNCKGLQYKDNDCWKDPLQTMVSYVVGDTFATAFTASVNPAFYSCVIEKRKEEQNRKANADVKPS